MKYILLTSILLFLSNCGGFQPLYKQTGSADLNVPKQFASVDVAVIKDRKGQILRNYLLDIFNPKGQPKEPEYLLKVELTESTYATATKQDATFTRSNITNRAEFRLDRVETRQTVLASMAQTTSSFDLIEDDLANTQALRSARDANLRVLSQKISSRLAIAMLSQKKERSLFRSMEIKLANNKVSSELGGILLRSINPEGIKSKSRYILYLSAREIIKQEQKNELYMKNLVSYKLFDIRKKKTLLKKTSRISDTINLKGHEKYDNKAVKDTRSAHLSFLGDNIRSEILTTTISKRKVREQDSVE